MATYFAGTSECGRVRLTCTFFFTPHPRHFLDPLDKSCPKFAALADLEVPLLTADDQVKGRPITKRSLGGAVADGTINNETLGYFVGRIYQVLVFRVLFL